MINAQNKGKQAERDVANYLTRCGLADANGGPVRRYVRTGTAGEHDEGDLKIPGVTIEVKHWAGDLTHGSIVTLLAKLARQCGPGYELGILVDRLDSIGGHRAGEWKCHLWLSTFRDLIGGFDAQLPAGDAPITMQLQTFVGLWIASGRAFVVNPFARATQ